MCDSCRYHPAQRKFLERHDESDPSQPSEFVDPYRPDVIKFPDFGKAQVRAGLGSHHTTTTHFTFATC